MSKMNHQELLKGLIRLHILHHATKAPFYGQWMIHELARHGYTLSPGTLYPMLHSISIVYDRALVTPRVALDEPCRLIVGHY
jgi:hypothetical protein